MWICTARHASLRPAIELDHVAWRHTGSHHRPRTPRPASTGTRESAVSNQPPEELIKQREIDFIEPHPCPNQAGVAATLLDGMDGILGVETEGSTRLRVTYQLPMLSLETIEEALSQIGFHLDGSLMARLRRAMVNYLEDTQCANLGHGQGQSNCTVKVFINRYQHLEHGCRDGRPGHWREYH